VQILKKGYTGKSTVIAKVCTVPDQNTAFLSVSKGWCQRVVRGSLLDVGGYR
jgi:hypothetical protein